MTGAPSLDLREGISRTVLRWGACLAAVLLAHGAIAAGLLAWQPPQDAGAPPPSPILIDLTEAATPMASIEDVSKLLPEPQMPEPIAPIRNPLLDMAPTPQPPPEVKIEITIDIPPPEPPPEVKIEITVDIPPPEPPPPVDLKPPPPKVVHKPPPKPPEKVVTRRPEPSRAPPSPAPVAARASGAPSPAPPAAVPQANPRAEASWKGALLAHLARHKRYPRASQSRGDEGVVYLRFTMTRQGGVIAERVERASGHDLLDREAVDLVRRAQPLPRPPADVPGQVFEFVVPIQFRLR
ncbi:MAG: energy transducer TonB [Reyranellaceae bacterium]